MMSTQLTLTVVTLHLTIQLSPVSYTHLDVYKRQGVSPVIPIDKIILSNNQV